MATVRTPSPSIADPDPDLYPTHAVVGHAFFSRLNTELTVEPGETVRLMHKSDGGWTLASKRLLDDQEPKEGYVPSLYLMAQNEYESMQKRHAKGDLDNDHTPLYQARHIFKAKLETELDLSPDDIVRVCVRRDGKGWVYASKINAAGECIDNGWVPSSYVKPHSFRDAGDANSLARVDGYEYARVRQAFNAKRPTELTILRGDFVRVCVREKESWWTYVSKICLNGKCVDNGWVPSNCLEPCSGEYLLSVGDNVDDDNENQDAPESQDDSRRESAPPPYSADVKSNGVAEQKEGNSNHATPRIERIDDPTRPVINITSNSHTLTPALNLLATVLKSDKSTAPVMNLHLNAPTAAAGMAMEKQVNEAAAASHAPCSAAYPPDFPEPRRTEMHSRECEVFDDEKRIYETHMVTRFTPLLESQTMHQRQERWYYNRKEVTALVELVCIWGFTIVFCILLWNHYQSL